MVVVVVVMQLRYGGKLGTSACFELSVCLWLCEKQTLREEPMRFQGRNLNPYPGDPFRGNASLRGFCRGLLQRARAYTHLKG